ncbi:hypothetical protein GOP47_0005515 [Adiantum capillus-veneris]|uniref:Uncharacterized protein n=1 Tax=Adiantum capillus-veneris TaxID=13818 RepID=A0A9D4ZNM2_ADICA|nr:hypothetical protein GOP47_0005515 [Adiantum capillus-veneris]
MCSTSEEADKNSVTSPETSCSMPKSKGFPNVRKAPSPIKQPSMSVFPATEPLKWESCPSTLLPTWPAFVLTPVCATSIPWPPFSHTRPLFASLIKPVLPPLRTPFLWALLLTASFSSLTKAPDFFLGGWLSFLIDLDKMMGTHLL